MNELLDSWRTLMARLGVAAHGERAGASLLARYAEPHRRYHDTAHLADVLGHIDDLAEHASDLDVVVLAAWFHDAIYDPRTDDNEQKSAELATKMLAGLGVSETVADEVGRLVRITADHTASPGDANAAVLCDADLAVLAGDEDLYLRYVERVRAEFAHLDDASFARGRAAVLGRLLARPTLYATAAGRSRWELAARSNIAAELAARQS